MENPFSLMFGKSPTSLIDRPVETSQVVGNFQTEEINQQVFIITGVRGYGKTCLMTNIAKKLEGDKKWIHVELNPNRDLLESLLTKLNSNKSCFEVLKNIKVNLSFFGFSVGLQNEVEIKDVEVAISEILKEMKKHEKRLLITIDEVTNSQQMRVFTSAFQMLIREDLPIFLLMTGLYENINALQNEKNLTFLYRSPRIDLAPLNSKAIAEEYKRIFECNDDVAAEMSKLTRGYPFAYQVLGYLTFENGGDYTSIIGKYEQYLAEFVYEKIWSEMSTKDRAVVQGIARVGEGPTKNIREELGMKQNEFSPYRDRLLKKGIIAPDGRGSVKFTLPLFDKFCLEN